MKKLVSAHNPKTAVSLIAEFEGCRLKAYKCPANVWTIGYGHTKGVKQGDTITKEQAIELLEEDIVKFHNELASLVKVPLGPNQYIALMSFIYNFGLTKCKGYSLFKELNQGNYIKAASKLPDYRSPGTPYENGLLRRRFREQELFLKDEDV